MRGTRKRPSSASGAPASTSSRGSDGRTTSGRVTFSIGTACVVGGTSAASVTSRDLRDGAEDDVELRGQAVELGVVEGEPRQPREVRDLLAGDLGHAAPLQGGQDRAEPRRRRRRAATCPQSIGAGTTGARVLPAARGPARPPRHARRRRDRPRRGRRRHRQPRRRRARPGRRRRRPASSTLPPGGLADALLTSAQSVPGVVVESLRPYGGGSGLHRDLELVEELAAAPEQGLALLVDHAPGVFRAGWARAARAGRRRRPSCCAPARRRPGTAGPRGCRGCRWPRARAGGRARGVGARAVGGARHGAGGRAGRPPGRGPCWSAARAGRASATSEVLRLAHLAGIAATRRGRRRGRARGQHAPARPDALAVPPGPTTRPQRHPLGCADLGVPAFRSTSERALLSRGGRRCASKE